MRTVPPPSSPSLASLIPTGSCRERAARGFFSPGKQWKATSLRSRLGHFMVSPVWFPFLTILSLSTSFLPPSLPSLPSSFLFFLPFTRCLTIYFLPLSETHSSSSSARQFPVLIARASSQPDREIPPSCEFRFCFHPDVVIPLPLRSIGRQAFSRPAIAPGCYPRSPPPALDGHHNNRAGSTRATRRSSQSLQTRNRAFHASFYVPAHPGSGNGTASAGCSGSSWVGRP